MNTQQTIYKTYKVIGSNGLNYWRYKENHNEIMKNYYHLNETCRNNKCEKIFYKNLNLGKIPHDKSILKYKLTTENVENIRDYQIRFDTNGKERIARHFNNIISRINMLNGSF